MFIGHFGVAFAAKKITSKVSLGTLVLAVQFLDLIWPLLVLLKVEKVSVEPGATAYNDLNFEFYPYTHGLLGAFILSCAFAGIFYLLHPREKCAMIMGGLVFSHWILDFITHRPDLPLAGDNTLKVGLGLWNSVEMTILVELLIFIVGIIIYLKYTPPVTRSKKIGFGLFVVFLLSIFAFASFGPKPPADLASFALAGPALAMWLLVPWAAWIDRR